MFAIAGFICGRVLIYGPDYSNSIYSTQKSTNHVQGSECTRNSHQCQKLRCESSRTSSAVPVLVVTTVATWRRRCESTIASLLLTTLLGAII
jgi:glycerol uptake facilitator-like aquaporin